METLLQDVRHALRTLRKAPGTTVAAVLTLALGLGATTTIYGLADWLLLRPVPGIEDSDELRHVWTGRPNEDGSFSVTMLSMPNLEDVTGRLTTLSGMAGYQTPPLNVATDTGGARRLEGAFVTPSYFDLLGVEPALGRTFTAEEHDMNAGIPVALISHRLWAGMFQRDPAVLGREVRVNGHVFEVVGVLPEGFHGIERLAETDLFMPGSTYALARHLPEPEAYARRDRGFFYMLVGRLADGATWKQVEAELGALDAHLAELYPEINAERWEAGYGFHVMGPVGRPAMESGATATTLALLMGVSGLVLLIACANVANLLLIRGLGRQAEMAVRKALGAGRWRLLRQQLTEGMVLWILGGLASLAVAAGLIRLFEGARVGYGQIGEIHLDAGMVGFAAVVTVVVGLAFATIPALGTLRVAPAGMLEEAGPTGTRRRLGTGTALTVLQLSASLTLLVGALLMVRSLLAITAVDPGFDPTGVATVLVQPDSVGYSPDESHAYTREFARRLRQRPGVTGVAVASRAPMQCCGSGTILRDPGDPSGEALLRPQFATVHTAGFFETLGIPVLRGRVFDESELAPAGGQATPVVVLSASMARQLFGDANAIGRIVEFATRDRTGRQFEVIGVVGDAHYRNLVDEPEPMLYEPAGLDGPARPGAYILLRARPGFLLDEAAREIAASLDSSLPVSRVQSMDEAMAGSVAERTMLARLIGSLAFLAGLLAAVGVYGVVAFAVNARTRELGIRMAMGAGPRRIVGLVLRSAAGVTGAGLVLGLAGAFGLTRFIQSRLYGVAPFDATVWTMAAVALVALAFLAALVPARRATRVDPVQTLRAQ